MKFSWTFRFLLLILFTSSYLQAEINIGIEQQTVNGEANNLTIFYTATTDYSSPPFSFWNSQLFTLRWPTSLGGSVIESFSNTSSFSFTKDGPATDGGDGFYYQKFTASGTNVVQPIALAARLDVINILVSHPTAATGNFELITLPNDWVRDNFGTASVNAAVGGEQFGEFAPARADGVVLPVNILAFTATPSRKHIDLAWQTSSETGFSHYEVERMKAVETPESYFQKIGELPGRNEPSYNWKDYSALAGIPYFYRLKLVDLDGGVAYSQIKTAQLADYAKAARIFPNPVGTEGLRLTFHALLSGTASVTVLTVDGRLLRQWQFPATGGLNDVSLKTDDLPPGHYLLRIRPGRLASVQTLFFAQQ